MANRFPLVINNSTTVVGELQVGDSINLSLSGIYDGSSTGTNTQYLKATGNGRVIWASAGDVYLTQTQTLQNKTFTSCTLSGATNTLSNIGNSSLVNSSITINGSPISLGGSVTTPDTNTTYTLGTAATTTANKVNVRITPSTGSPTSFDITGTRLDISRDTSGNLTLTPNLNTLTAGSYLTGVSYNGSSNVTFAVNATSTGTTDGTIVARGANGNFTAGTITATAFTGNLTNTLTLNTSGTGISGSTTFNNSAAVTFTVTSNATSTGTTDGTIVSRGANGNFTAGNITATSFIRSGGTSSQFLKADGSIDSNTYVTEAFAAGTTLLFYQANAPTGWTKVTTHDNKALRVVSGTGGGSGGTSTFTSVFTSRTPQGSVSGSNSGGGVSGHTLSWNEMPSHSHSCNWYNTGSEAAGRGAPLTGDFQNRVLVTAGPNFNTNSAGSSWSHSHGFSNPSWDGTFTGTAMNFAVQYIDVIICSKN